MADTHHPRPLESDEEPQRVVCRMRAIEAEFVANGLSTHLTDARAGLKLRAMLSPSGKREAEIRIDGDGYVEVRYWSPAGASAAQISATALRALMAMTSAPTGPSQPGYGHRCPHMRPSGEAASDGAKDLPEMIR